MSIQKLFSFLFLFFLIFLFPILSNAKPFFSVNSWTAPQRPDLHLPLLTGKNKQVSEDINTDMGRIAGYFMAEKLASYGEKSNIACTYELTRNDEDLVSILLTWKYGLPGNEQTTLRGVTFRSATGARLQASELNIDHSKLVQALRQKEANGGISYNTELARVKVPDNFYIDTKGNVHLIFDKGSIATEASGILDIDMGQYTIKP